MNVAHIHPTHPPNPSRRSVRVPSAVALGSLEDGMMVCLGLLKSDPERFEPVAVTWHARWCAARPGVTFDESRTVLSALEALAGPKPAAAARELSTACRRSELGEISSVLDAWLSGRSDAGPEVARIGSPDGPSAA